MPKSQGGVRYRTRGQERREHRFELKLSAAERGILATAADRDGLTLAAYLVKAGLDVAQHRIAPVGAIQREMLAELFRIRGMVSRIGQAMSRLSSADASGPDLEPAVAYCMRVVRHVDDAAQLVRRRLP
jgi:hypothetical protein